MTHSHDTNTPGCGALEEEALALFAAHALASGPAAECADHVAACRACEQYVADVRAIAADLPTMEPTADERAALRAGVAAAMVRERPGPRAADRPARSPRPEGWSRLARRAFTATVLFAGGLFVGRAGLAPGDAASDGIVAEVQTAREGAYVVHWASGADTLEVVFDRVQRVRMRGTIDAPEIRDALQSALAEADNPRGRLRAVQALGQAGVRPAGLAGPIATLAAEDPVPGIRMHALQALAQLQAGLPLDPYVQAILVDVMLSDSSTAFRLAALEALSLSGMPDAALRPYLLATRQDADPRLRMRATMLLRDDVSSLDRMPD